MLVKSPWFTAVAVLTLAIGIGATTSIFTVVEGVLLRPLPYADPYRTVAVYRTHKRVASPMRHTSIATYWDWKDRNVVFEDLALIETFGANLAAGDSTERISGANVTQQFFSVLGVSPLLGAVFPSGESGLDPTSAVISHGLWKRCFGGQQGVLGAPIMLDGNSLTIVGVMPAGFSLPDQADVWKPLTIERRTDERDTNVYLAIARLRPGVTMEQAEANMQSVSDDIASDYPSMAEWGTKLISLQDEAVSTMRKPLLVLLAAVGLVLVITCVNVANLLLVRGDARHGEVAIRAALGAGRSRLVRQFLIESLALSLLGGCLGILLAFWGIDILLAWSPANLPRLDEIHIDGQVLGFTLFLLPCVAVLFGSVPALHASKTALSEALKEGARASVTRSGSRIRTGLVVCEMALSLMLLIGAGLLIRSFAQLRDVNPGFEVEHILTMRIALPSVHYPEEHGRDTAGLPANEFFRMLKERIEVLPGVVSAGFTTAVPIFDGTPNVGVQTDRDSLVSGLGRSSNAEFQWVSSNYHRVISQQIERGRPFDASDHPESPNVAIINKSVARVLWGDEDPIGRSFRFMTNTVRVIGIASDVKRFGLDRDAPREVYLPLSQNPGVLSRSIVIRTAGDPTLISDDINHVITGLDPRLPVYNVQSMGAIVSDSFSRSRFITLLFSLFASVASLLAVVGVYSVISYSVGRRNREIGLRMALGAQRRDILHFVLRDGLTLIACGLGIGFALSFAGSRILSSMLFEVSASDPVTFIGVALLLAAVALVACYIPARRATKVDPMVALRYE